MLIVASAIFTTTGAGLTLRVLMGAKVAMKGCGPSVLAEEAIIFQQGHPIKIEKATIFDLGFVSCITIKTTGY